MLDTPDDLTIIGIGSSAGGLEAIRELVATLPAEVPVSYVVVQHMSPHHKSLMTELVARETALTVKNVEDGTKPESNVIYVTPPKTDVVFEQGRLHLKSPSQEPAHPKPSVDRFLVSLAENHGDKSVAVILSGTGSDGSYGIQAIREVGGITIAQDSDSAKYDGMPNSAVNTGCVDLILRPLEIGTHLKKILSFPRDFSTFRSGTLKETPVSDLLQILLARTRVDFREYKQTTINRRIERRMVALGIGGQEEYTQFCRNNPHAVDALFKDLLISVTRFFRDKDEFARLAERIPKLLEQERDEPLRVWIAGCATGEEAYSIAIMLSEALGGPNVDLKSHVQIFATDIDKGALQIARRGVYGAAALNDIPHDLAEKYIIHQNDGVRVIENLRSAILFSDHNICQDPPFQKIDLLCCRNVLIYFGNALQQKVMSRFHYSMKPQSLMFLGTAESVAGSDELFVQDRAASHIYQKRTFKSGTPKPSLMPMIVRKPYKDSPRNAAEEAQRQSTDRQLFEALVVSLGTNSALVTEDYSIARVFGDISPFIEVTEVTNLKMHLDLLRSPLREEARSLITISLKHGAHRAGVRHLLSERDHAEIRLDVYPIVAQGISERAALVVFTPIPVDHSKITESLADAGEPDDPNFSRIRLLETEVATTREALQQTIEELETSNEELQSLNEELQSTNEELQATNEELETSNEELQSSNEELITVNEELQVTASELSGRTGQLVSVLESSPLAVIVVDTAFQVMHATHPAIELFGISSPTSHPHISQCVLPKGYPSLAPLCSQALSLGETIEHTIDTDTHQVRLTFSPYFDETLQVQGITVVVVKSEFPHLAREMEMILNTGEIFLMHRDKDGKILRISEGAAKHFGLNRIDVIGTNINDHVDSESARAILSEDKDILQNQGSPDVEQARVVVNNTGETIWMKRHRFKFHTDKDSDPSVYVIATDVTSQVEATRKSQLLLNHIDSLHDFAGVGYWSLDVAKDLLTWSPEVFRIHRTTPEEYTPQSGSSRTFYHANDIDEIVSIVEQAIKASEPFKFTKRLHLKNDEIVHVQSFGVPVTDKAGNLVQLIGCLSEVPKTQ